MHLGFGVFPSVFQNESNYADKNNGGLITRSIVYSNGNPSHRFEPFITKTRLYNFDPLKPHFYIVKLGFTGVHIIFLISAQKHRLLVLV